MFCPPRGWEYHETVIAPKSSNVSIPKAAASHILRCRFPSKESSFPARNPPAKAKPSAVEDRPIDKPDTQPNAKPRKTILPVMLAVKTWPIAIQLPASTKPVTKVRQ